MLKQGASVEGEGRNWISKYIIWNVWDLEKTLGHNKGTEHEEIKKQTEIKLKPA